VQRRCVLWIDIPFAYVSSENEARIGIQKTTKTRERYNGKRIHVSVAVVKYSRAGVDEYITMFGRGRDVPPFCTAGMTK
jgi:hypothetical protein